MKQLITTSQKAARGKLIADDESYFHHRHRCLKFWRSPHTRGSEDRTKRDVLDLNSTILQQIFGATNQKFASSENL